MKYPQDILSEPHLYHYFHQYVTSLMSAESLLCIRLINIFEGLVTANRMKEADDIGKLHILFLLSRIALSHE